VRAEPDHADVRSPDTSSVIVGHVLTIALPEGLGLIELLTTNDGHTASFRRRSVDGTVAWQALPPDGEQDAWTEVTVTGSTVHATSWSCWRVEFDAASGDETERGFTK